MRIHGDGAVHPSLRADCPSAVLRRRGLQRNWFWLEPGYEYPDLTRLRLEHGIFSGGRSWNDEISSVRAGMGNSYVHFFEHINFGGSSLVLGIRESVDNLTALGWNDRVSSVRHIQVSYISTA